MRAQRRRLTGQVTTDLLQRLVQFEDDTRTVTRPKPVPEMLAVDLRMSAWTAATVWDYALTNLAGWTPEQPADCWTRLEQLTALSFLRPAAAWPAAVDITGVGQRVSAAQLGAVDAGVPSKWLAVAAELTAAATQSTVDRPGVNTWQMGWASDLRQYPDFAWASLRRLRPYDLEEEMVVWLRLVCRSTMAATQFIDAATARLSAWTDQSLQHAAWFCAAGIPPEEARKVLADHPTAASRVPLVQRLMALAALDAHPAF